MRYAIWYNDCHIRKGGERWHSSNTEWSWTARTTVRDLNLFGSFRSLSDAALDRILAISDGISGDVQELCETVWLATSNGDVIGDAEINAGLRLVFAREEKAFGPALARLTASQAAVLKGLAYMPDARPFSGDFISRCGIRNVGTVTRALTRLQNDEIIFEHSGGWRFTNPFFREWLKTM